MKKLDIKCAIVILFLLPTLLMFGCGPSPLPEPEPEPASVPAPTPTTAELEVHFIDVGQGDAILIDLEETEVLIDGGDKTPGVVEYLSDFVDGTLDVVVATHPHADHIGGLIAVLDAFEVEEIWLNGDTSTSKTYQEFMSRVNTEDASIHEALRGQSIEVDGLIFHVLHPIKPLVGDINNNSIVLRLSHGDIDFLFTGDAEKEAEASILEASLVVQAQILKVGHHGSSSSSSPKFLNVVKPEIAIYMAGEGNKYGHPHEETTAALTEVGAEIYGTDICGTIVVTSDGKSFSVQREKQCAPLIVSPTPVNFTVTNLAILPVEVEPEETVTISVTVTNSGGSTGTHTVVLKVNGAESATKSVTLDTGESQKVSFTAASAYSGTYTVEINGLEGTFTVAEKVVQEQDLFLEIVSVTSPIGKGYTATLRAHTEPGAYCTITVYYKSGPSSASGLYPKEADSGGNVSWSWKVGTRTTPGSWQIVVTGSLGGETVSQTTYFTVY